MPYREFLFLGGVEEYLCFLGYKSGPLKSIFKTINILDYNILTHIVDPPYK